MIEPRRTPRRGRTAAAFPGIKSDAMMIAASLNERDLRTSALHQLKTKYVAIERERPVDVVNLQMHVADAHAGIDWCAAHLTGLCRDLANKRGNAQGRDAVACLAQYLETEAVKGKTLPRFGDRPCFVNDNTRDRGRFVVRDIPVHGPVEIADRHAAVDIDRSVRKRTHA